MSWYQGKTVLVTGAAGFLGSHMCDRLLAEGAIVFGVDNLLTGRKENLEEAQKNAHFTFIEADAIAPPDTYLPPDVKLNAVFHLASPASPPRYQEHPVETYLVNAMGTHNILQYLLTNRPECRFIFASSSEVYGDPKEHPQKEGYWGNVNPNGPRACYDEAKRLGETICGTHARDFGMDVRIVRIFNTFGPRMNPIDGRVIPNFVLQALKNEPMTIYGDGSQTRSFCYVDDLIKGIMLLGAVDAARGQTVNLGNAFEKSMRDMAQLIKTAIGATSPFVPAPLPGDDPTRRNPDLSKAKQLLGWEPHTPFEEGLEKTIAYFKTQL